MKIKFKKSWLFLATSITAIAATTFAIACSNAQTDDPEKVVTPPATEQPKKDDKNTLPADNNPTNKGNETLITSEVSANPLFDFGPDPLDIVDISGILQEQKLEKRFPDSGLKALDTSISKYPSVSYNGRGIQESGNNNPFTKYSSDHYKEIQNEQYDTVKDYTFRIKIQERQMNVKGDAPAETWGTIWVLDYLKEKDGKYPLTWYFGTNLHVASPLNHQYAIKGESALASHEAVLIQISDTENVKLTNYPTMFYSAQNFLGADDEGIELNAAHGSYSYGDLFNYKNLKNYAKDFAVIKVEFKDEAEARKVTRDFANNEKYATPKLKFNKQSILETKTGDDLASEKNIYVYGYPAAGTSGATVNIRSNIDSSETASGYSVLVRDYMIYNNYGQKIPGIYDNMYINGGSIYQTDDKSNYGNTGRSVRYPIDMWLYDRYYTRFGLTIGIDNSNLGHGSSGSIVIDRDYNVIGVNWGSEDTSQSGLIDPLVSSEYKNKDGKVVFYEYDLIHGRGSKQTRSYASELKKLLAKEEYKDKTSWLLGEEVKPTNTENK
ncbi:MIP family Ig-specific serine endopeptidase [Mycoplasmopsis agassizii]|uniref:DUF31 domain-containing protein n=1 Tax=Mycoplasmopsis agassizii TaxID=33922 RepID=A0ABX4H5M1_9BACT|nr:hypothetical protein [Mycoplasmopsis agassizii]PAF55078.1 hypothetical protein CJF60_00095 [Mycoplasmopsis agassizii]SMC19126.1 Putative peptidase [Mycoplasmopsis agassizii]